MTFKRIGAAVLTTAAAGALFAGVGPSLASAPATGSGSAVVDINAEPRPNMPRQSRGCNKGSTIRIGGTGVC